MHPALASNDYRLSPRRSSFQARYAFEAVPHGGSAPSLLCREVGLGPLRALVRLWGSREFTSFDVLVETPDSEPVLRVTDRAGLCSHHTEVRDSADCLLGFITGGASLFFFDNQNRPLGEVMPSRQTSSSGLLLFSVCNDRRREVARIEQAWGNLGAASLLHRWAHALYYDVRLSTVSADDLLRPMILASTFCLEHQFPARYYRSFGG